MKHLYLAIFLVCLAGCSSNSGSQSEQSSAKLQNAPKKYQFDLSSNYASRYEVVEVEDSSVKAVSKPLSSYSAAEVSWLPTNNRKTYRILVSRLRDYQLEPTIEKILSDVVGEDDDIDEVTLLLYSDKDDVKGVCDVATAVWAPDGKWGSTKPDAASNNDREGYKIVIDDHPKITADLAEMEKERLKENSEEKFGLNKFAREQVFRELVATEDRAIAEADEAYPTDSTQPGWQANVSDNNQMRENLKDKYRAQLDKEYHISEKQVWDIISEGFKENWFLD